MVHFRWNTVTDNILCEQDDAGQLLATYTQEPGLYGELISQRRDGADELLPLRRPGIDAAVDGSEPERDGRVHVLGVWGDRGEFWDDGESVWLQRCHVIHTKSLPFWRVLLSE